MSLVLPMDGQCADSLAIEGAIKLFYLFYLVVAITSRLSMRIQNLTNRSYRCEVVFLLMSSPYII